MGTQLTRTLAKHTPAASVADIALAKHTLEQSWQTSDLLQFNGHNVRFRTMNAVEARWHRHPQSDELFIVLTGQLEIDLRATDKTISTHILLPNQMLAVHAGCEHRARSKGLTTLLVLDALE